MFSRSRLHTQILVFLILLHLSFCRAAEITDGFVSRSAGKRLRRQQPAATTTVTIASSTFGTSTSASVPTTSPNVPSPITFTGIEPPTLYMDRGTQNIVVSGTNFTSLSLTKYSLQLTNISIPDSAVRLTVLTDTLLAVTVDTDAIGWDGIYRLGTINISINGSPAVTQQVRWVDPVKSIATRVYPNKVPVGTETQVNILGIGLLPPIGQALCVFNTSTVTTSKATWVEGNGTYICGIPTLPTSSILEVSLLYYTPQLDLTPFGGKNYTDVYRPVEFVSTVVGEPLILYYRAPPPKLVEAHFTYTGAVEVEFDKPVTIYDTNIFMVDPIASSLKVVSRVDGRERFGCDKIFANPSGTTGKLWFNNGTTECRVQRMGPTMFRVEIGAEGVLKMVEAGLSPLAIGDFIGVKDGAVWTAGEELSETATGGTNVLGPRDLNKIVKPIVRVTAPQIVGSCSDVTLDLSRSMGSAGRNFNQSVFSVSPPNDSLQTELNHFAQDFVAGNELVYTILANSFPIGKYSLTFALQNFLGGVGSATITIEKFARNDIPYVTITGPSNDAPLDQVHSVIAKAHSSCGSLRPVSFLWESNDVSIQDENGTQVVIQQYSMDAQRLYSFVVRAQFTDVDNPPVWVLNYSFTSELDRVVPVTVTEFVGGSTVDIEGTQPSPLFLSTAMFDSGYPPNNVNVSDFTCIWNCTRLGENSASTPCPKLETGQNLSIPAICNGANITGFLAPGNYALDFEAVRIETGAMNHEGGPVYVNVVDGWVPLVGIVPSVPYPTSWDTYDLKATIDSQSVFGNVNDVEYTWNSNDTCRGETLSTVNLQDTSMVQWNAGTPTLRFLPEALIPSGRYCFTVFAKNKQTNAVGYASTTVTIREAPFAGYCSLNSTQGVAYQSVFRITCAGWVTDPQSIPIFYTYWIRKQGETTWSNFGPLTQSSVLDTLLAQGEYEITINITDAAGSIADTQPVFSVSVQAAKFRRQQTPIPAGATPEAYTFLNDTINDYLSTSDYRTAQKNLIVAIQELTNESLNSPYHHTLLELYALLLNSGDIYMDAQSGAPYMANTLQAITMGSYNLTETVQMVFEALNELVAQIDETTGESGGCVTGDTSAVLIKIMDSVLGSVEQSSSTSVISMESVGKIMGRLEGCVYRTLTCGDAVSFTETYVERTLGIASLSNTDEMGFCGRFKIPQLGTAVAGQIDDGSCVRYSCGTTATLSNTAAPSGITALGANVTSLTLLANNGTAQPLNISLPTKDIEITLEISPQLLTQKQYDSSLSYICAWYDGQSGDWSTEGCIIGSVDEAGRTAVCQCSHLTDFVLALQQGSQISTETTAVASAPTITPTQSSVTAVSPPTTIQISSAIPAPAVASPHSSVTPLPVPVPVVASPSSTASAAGLTSPTSQPQPPPSKSSNKAGQIAGAVIGTLLGIALALAAIYCYRRYNHSRWYNKDLPPPATRHPAHPLAPPPRNRNVSGNAPGRAPSMAQPRAHGFREARREELPEYLFPPSWEEHLQNAGEGSRERLYRAGERI